jgi:hypothetical protein
MVSPAELTYKTLDGYRMLLRENARQFWSGQGDWYDFYSSMMLTIERGFKQAWAEGMETFGLKIDDQNQEEKTRLAQEVISEKTFVEGLADYVDQHSKANGGKLTLVFQRVEQWVAGYNRIRQLATAMAAKDKPLEWVIDSPRESCGSCVRLNGKVKRGSYWQTHVTPKDWDKLECRNGCKCSLKPTTKPLSKGPLPKIP